MSDWSVVYIDKILVVEEAVDGGQRQSLHDDGT